MAGHEGQGPQLSRRDLFKAGIAGGVAVAATTIPFSGVFGTQRPTESMAPLTADQRIAEAKRRIEGIRERRFILPDTYTGNEIPPLVGAFKPGQRVDRGPQTIKRKKVLFVRADDFWWEEQGREYATKARELGVPLTAFPVGLAVLAFPNLMLEMKRDGVVFANHTMNHPAIDQFLTDDMMKNELLPQKHALENLFLPGQEELFIGPPFGAGATPGESYTAPSISLAAKNARAGIAGWTTDSRVWDNTAGEPTVSSIVENVLKGLVPGAIIINHPDANGLEAQAMPIWVAEARRMGYVFKSMAAIPHTSNVGF